MKVLGYIRVSTKLQSDKGNSLNLQSSKIKDYSKLNDFNLIEIYEDRGISGMSIDKRDGYKEMIEYLTNNQIDGVVVWSLSRLGRRMKDVVEFMDTLKQNNINFFSIKENLPNNDKVGSLIMNILGSINEIEVEVISERIKDVKRHKKQNGEVYGRLQYGWDNVNGKLIKNKSEFSIIKRIKNLRSRGYSWRKISNRLKGLVHCGDCDRKMRIEGSGKIVNGKSYRYFKCSSYKENEKLRRRQLDELDKFNCVSGSRGNKISKDKLDSVVWKCLYKVLSNSEIIINEYKKRFAENLGSKDRFVSKLEYYKKELTKLDIRKNKMINMVLDGKFSEDDYEKWFDNEYEEKKIEINSKLDLVKIEVGKYGYVDKIENWMDLMKEDLIRDFNIERKEDKRRIVERYIEKVFVNEIGDIDNERRFEINLILRLGKKKGKIQFDYDIKEKSLNLKLIEKDFYIVNNDFVARAGLEPATFGL